MTLHRIGKASSDKQFKRRLVEQDRITPLRWPLDPALANELIGVDPDDAWMPLSIALVQRLHRLWDLVTDDTISRQRVPGDEHLYQVLRVSLLATVRPLAESSDTGELAAELPGTLPSSIALADRQTSDFGDIDLEFEQLERFLIRDAVLLNFTPDTRTVEDALASYDRFHEKLALAHDELLLERFGEMWGSDDRLDDLRRAIQERRRRLRFGPGQELATALAILARVRELWELLDPGDPGYRRYRTDEDLYQTYRNLLLATLDAAEYEPVHDLAQTALPRLLPDADDPLPRDLFGDDTPADMERLKHEIIALAHRYHLTTMLDLDEATGLDERFPQAGAAWTRLRASIHRARNASATTDEQQPAGDSRSGRLPVDVTYAFANQLWWDLVDDLAPRRPTFEDLCDRLTERGVPIRPRTFSEKRRIWRQNGLNFPGPRPEIDAETAETANP